MNKMKKLMVHPNRQYLMQEDGEPFFYLADTVWELFHKLSYEESEMYLSTRARQGFNVIQAVCLAELDGIGAPNYYGEKSLLDYNEERLFPNEKYFAHVDRVIRLAEEKGIYVALLPTWGDKFNQTFGKGPQLLTPKNAAWYAEWLAHRYKKFTNIIWVLGGDRPLETDVHRAIIDAMGTTLKKLDPDRLITFHPPGATSSCEFVAGKDYIDFHMNQSGHDVDRCYDSADLLRKCFQTDNKPALDGESRYEDHPACFHADFNYLWNSADIRQNFYANVLCGACGQTYGNHAVWSCCTNPGDYFPYRWDEVLEHEGAEQFKYLKQLRLSRPYFELREANELLADASAAKPAVCAARGKDYAFVYSPLGKPFCVHLEKMGCPRIKATWFDPKTGETKVEGIFGTGVYEFVPECCGKGNDIVLILDNLHC